MTDCDLFAMHLNYALKLCFIFAIKNYMNKHTIFLNRRKKVAKVGKKSDFSYFRTFHCVILQSQCMAIQQQGG
jgi:hypothetical protein